MMATRGSRIRGDSGFSTVELLFAAMLSVMVMTVAYMMMDAATKSFRNVEVQTTSSTTAARASFRLSKPIREAQRPAVAEPYKLVFLADAVADDGVMEWVQFELKEGTTRLVEMTRSVDAGAAWGPEVVVADNIQNRLHSVPLFTYYSDPASSAIPATDPNLRSATKVVRLTVLTRASGVPVPPVYRVQTDVFLRNVSRESQ